MDDFEKHLLAATHSAILIKEYDVLHWYFYPYVYEGIITTILWYAIYYFTYCLMFFDSLDAVCVIRNIPFQFIHIIL